MIKPKTRHDDILTQELMDEILIYDKPHDKVYCLNHTLSAVYNACDGNRTLAQIKEAVSAQIKAPVSDEFILFALKQLDEKDLMANAEELKGQINLTIPRRELIKKAGLATMVALPVISTLVAPSAANAASGGCVAQYGQACNPGTTAPCCAPGLTCTQPNGFCTNF